jgi:hypothetical protein
MTEEEENLAIALDIKRWQGENAPHYIAEQLGAQILADCEPGIARWRAIAAAYDQLQRAARQ